MRCSYGRGRERKMRYSHTDRGYRERECVGVLVAATPMRRRKISRTVGVGPQPGGITCTLRVSWYQCHVHEVRERDETFFLPSSRRSPIICPWSSSLISRDREREKIYLALIRSHVPPLTREPARAALAGWPCRVDFRRGLTVRGRALSHWSSPLSSLPQPRAR